MAGYPPVRRVGDWDEARLALSIAPAAAINKAVKAEGRFFRDRIKENLRKRGALAGEGFERLSRGTRYRRRFDRVRGRRPLIARRDLLKSVKSVPLKVFNVFIGIPWEARDASGQPIVPRAIVAEYGRRGITVKATRAMLRFLYLLYASRGDMARHPPAKDKGPVMKIIVFDIPKRAFLIPVFEKYYGKNPLAARRRVLQRVAVYNAGLLGVMPGTVKR